MNEEELKETFRLQELNRRRVRLAALIENHAKLVEELNDPNTLQLDKQVKENVARQQAHIEKVMTPSYWRRLWAALWNK